MKIAISAVDGKLDAPFDPRFGRAANFCIVDLETEACVLLSNPAIHADSGAGVQAAQMIASQGVGAVISGNFGPKAYRALAAAGLKMYQAPGGDSFTVRDVLTRYRDGKLTQVMAPTRAGGHGQP